MTDNLCPKCLASLPDGYEFDHVAIDYALAGNTAVLKRMPRTERRELVAWGRRLGLTDNVIAERVHRSTAEIHNWLVDQTPRPPRSAAIDPEVKALWEQGLADRQIAARLSVGKSTVFQSRRRQGLAALFLSGGVRRVVPA